MLQMMMANNCCLICIIYYYFYYYFVIVLYVLIVLCSLSFNSSSYHRSICIYTFSFCSVLSFNFRHWYNQKPGRGSGSAFTFPPGFGYRREKLKEKKKNAWKSLILYLHLY